MKTLAELRALESELVARAAAKLAEIKDETPADALRALEADHDKILDEIEQVRGEIAKVVETERSSSNGDVLKADRERGAAIRKVVRQLGLGDELADEHISAGTSLNGFRQVAIDAAAKRSKDQGVDALNPHASEHRTYATARADKPKGTDATRLLIALAASRNIRGDAAAFVTHHWGRDGDVVARALSTSVGSAGGFLVPDEMAGEVIELLRPASALMALGPRIVPMPRGNISFARIQGGATASYQGENQPAQATQQTFGAVQLSAKKMTALVPMSNDMIRFPSVATDSLVRDDMIKAIAQRGDLAMIRGQGSQYAPRGLLSFANSPTLGGANLIAASRLVGAAYASGGQAQAITAVASVTTDLGNAELALLNANIPMTKPGWIFHPRTMMYLMNLRDGLGNFVYAAAMEKGLLRGKPFKTTTQIPVNLAAFDQNGNATFDGSEIYLADFAEVFVGEAYGLELEAFPGGSYLDANNQMVSGVSNDQTVMRAIVQHDMNMRQEAAVAVITGVRWF